MRHDWIKFNGEYIFEVHSVTGAITMTDAWEEHRWDDNPDIEVSRHGVYEFHWKAYNPLALEDVNEECPPDYATHEVYFKNTPLARDLVPIRVVTIDGELTYIPMSEWVDEYEGLNHPYDDCYACSGSTQFYMLTRPLVEMKHGVEIDELHALDAGMYSTVPKTHSILWYNKEGTGIIPGTSTFPQVIEGGTIDATYVLNEDHELVSNVQQSNWNKHFIIEVTWEDVADPSQIRFEEENTVTDCKNQYEFDFTIVQPQVIAGPEQVPAFSHEITTVAPGDAHEYYLDDEINPVPGAVYAWEIDGDDLSYIIGGYDVDGDWTLNTGDPQVMHAEGLEKIRVYWGAGLPATAAINNPHGFVHAEIINSCHDPIDPLRVDIIENTLAGQLRYWNQEETFIPTPFQIHPNNIEDYFYVELFEVNPVTGNRVPDGFAETVVIEPDTDLDLSAYFEFGNIDLSKSYRLRVWDGGFSYLEDEQVETDNFLSFTYTWNAWSHLGVSATDALAVIRMSIGQTELNDLDSDNPYWWIGDVDDDYGFFSNVLADVNTSGDIGIVDVRDLMRRVVGDLQRFRNNTPNFQVAGRFLDAVDLPARTFGTGDEVTGFSADNDEDLMFEFTRNGTPYEGTAHPDNLYYKSNVFTLESSTNLMNIYLAGMGDLNSKNSSVMGSGIAKAATTAELAYTGKIDADIGDVVTVPVRVTKLPTLPQSPWASPMTRK